MPDANALGGEACRLASREGDRAFFRGRQFGAEAPFEIWLSQLAQDLPYLSERENQQNHTHFVTLREAIAAVILDRQQKALRRAPPWLFQLLSVWHETRATVITFNYDTLVESGVESAYLLPEHRRIEVSKLTQIIDPPGAQEHNKVHASDVLRGQPPAVNDRDREPAPTFRLLKLHGSIDWWRAYNDISGTTLARWGETGRFGEEVNFSEQERRALLPGRGRFIVPPLATKAPYYTAPLLHQLWQDAYEAIAGADRLTLIGYSLPLTDFVVSGMVESAMRSWTRAVPVDVVDRNPDPVVRRVEALGGGNSTPFASVKEFSEAASKRGSRDVLTAIEHLDHMRPRPSYPGAVIVRWHPGRGAPSQFNVETVKRRDGRAILILDPNNAGRLQAVDGQPTLESFPTRVQGATELQVRIPSGTLLPIVGIGLMGPAYANASTYTALLLRAAGRA
jgi:hypothetical protein